MESGVLRGSCNCGKVRYELRGPPRVTYYCHCGTLDEDLPLPPSVHAFVASKANWIEITDDLPQHPEYFA
jgi:hypothetical protein